MAPKGDFAVGQARTPKSTKPPPRKAIAIGQAKSAKSTKPPTEAPTQTPTLQPTETPTHRPSETPTNAPTHPPSLTPTHTPTPLPTHNPTLAPSAASTAAAVAAASAVPSLAPSRASTERIPQRLMCYGTGDPHFFPFIGGKFDIHHEGVFDVFKSDKVHVQMRLKTCREKKPWSGGLSVKCIIGLAVKLSDGQVVETSTTKRGLMLSGHKLTTREDLDGGETVVPGAIKAKYKTTKHRIHADEYQIGLYSMELYNTFYISLSAEGRALFGKSPGVCGGGGQKQFTMVKDAEKAEDNMARAANGHGTIGYPCRSCIAGIGYMGAMCKCQEYVVPPASQLFETKTELPAWHHPVQPETEHGPDAQKLKSAKQHCLSAMLADPVGGLAFQHPDLKPLVLDAVDNCAEDREEGDNPEGDQDGHQMDHDGGGSSAGGKFNAEEAIHMLCDEADNLVRRADPSKVLCAMVTKCGLQSDRCDGKPSKYQNKKKKKLL